MTGVSGGALKRSCDLNDPQARNAVASPVQHTLLLFPRKMKPYQAALCSALATLAVACRDKAPPAPPAAAASADGVVRIAVAALAEGFKPADIHVKQGQNVELLFKRDTDDTCATDVVFKALSIKKDLPLGQSVAVKIPTEARAEYTFTCGMGMHKSRVVVE